MRRLGQDRERAGGKTDDALGEREVISAMSPACHDTVRCRGDGSAVVDEIK